MNGIAQKLIGAANGLGKNRYMRALRDGFMLIMPFTMLASVASLLSGLVFGSNGLLNGVLAPEVLSPIVAACTAVLNATTNMLTLLIGAIIAYSYAKIRKYKNPILAAIMALVAVVIFMPVTVSVANGDADPISASNLLSFSYTGSGGMIVGILVGLFGTDLFIVLSTTEKLHIKMHESVPEAIATSFNNLIPVILTGAAFGLVALVFNYLGSTLYEAINTVIAAPLKGLTTSFPGFLLLTAIANALFIFGIHPTVINSPILKPFLLAATAENMAAYAANQPLPNIINGSFVNYANRLGGVGCTLALIIAIFLFSRRQQNRSVAKVALIPGIFNINEPIIFGLPICYNPILAIPFVLSPVLSYSIGYAATYFGFVDPLFMDLPATTPIGISGFLAGGGDIKVALVQLVALAACVLLYTPFLKLYERSQEVGDKEDAIAEAA